jgi:hypothetical protein
MKFLVKLIMVIMIWSTSIQAEIDSNLETNELNYIKDKGSHLQIKPLKVANFPT